MSFLTGTTFRCQKCGEWIYHNGIHVCDDSRLQDCGHIFRHRVFAKEGGEYCSMCNFQAVEFAAQEAQRILQAEIAKARQAALEEAARTECPYCASGIPLKKVDGLSGTVYYHYQNEEKWRIGCFASRIHILISGVGLHASQQPHAVDLASASLRPNH